VRRRWMASEGFIGLISKAPTGPVSVDIRIGSYYRPRGCTIYLNDTKVFEQEVFGMTDISFQGTLREGINILHIVSSKQAESPKKNRQSTDSRLLAFVLSDYN
jgi:hypothetical protein